MIVFGPQDVIAFVVVVGCIGLTPFVDSPMLGSVLQIVIAFYFGSKSK